MNKSLSHLLVLIEGVDLVAEQAVTASVPMEEVDVKRHLRAIGQPHVPVVISFREARLLPPAGGYPLPVTFHFQKEVTVVGDIPADEVRRRIVSSLRDNLRGASTEVELIQRKVDDLLCREPRTNDPFSGT